MVINEKVKQDIKAFIAAMQNEMVDTKQLGLIRTKADILRTIESTYVVEG